MENIVLLLKLNKNYFCDQCFYVHLKINIKKTAKLKNLTITSE